MIAALSKAVGYLCDMDRKGMSSSQGMKGGDLCMPSAHTHTHSLQGVSL